MRKLIFTTSAVMGMGFVLAIANAEVEAQKTQNQPADVRSQPGLQPGEDPGNPLSSPVAAPVAEAPATANPAQGASLEAASAQNWDPTGTCKDRNGFLYSPEQPGYEECLSGGNRGSAHPVTQEQQMAGSVGEQPEPAEEETQDEPNPSTPSFVHGQEYQDGPSAQQAGEAARPTRHEEEPEAQEDVPNPTGRFGTTAEEEL